jgi:hypothetical protein
MPKSDFELEIEDYLVHLKKTVNTLDVSHISAEGMKDTPEVGIPFNRALSYIEAARELVNQARKNLNAVLKASRS